MNTSCKKTRYQYLRRAAITLVVVLATIAGGLLVLFFALIGGRGGIWNRMYRYWERVGELMDKHWPT